MPILLLLLALLLGLGFVWGLFAAARRGHPTVEPDAAGMTFRHGLPLKAFAVFALVGAEGAFAAWAVTHPTDARRFWVPLAVAAGALAVAGAVLCWEAFRFALHVSPAGLDCRSPWAGRRVLPWAAVRRVEFSAGNGWFVVRATDGGRPVRVSAFVPGAWRLLDEFERRLAPDQLRAAAPGYRWVGRRWPFRPEQLSGPPHRSRFFWLRVVALAAGMLGLLLVGLFAVNGLVLAAREQAVTDRVEGVPVAPGSPPGRVTVVAYNVAKGFAHLGGVRFADPAAVRDRLDRMAATIRAERPDLVFLSEALTECGPCPVDQVEHLARACGLPFVATGENYNVGLPFYRVAGGNAILSRRMLRGEGNPSLAGRQPFFVTHNNRRALFASLEIGDRRVWLGSLHNDSFDTRNNAEQVRQILRYVDDRPCVLAGDFNAEPGSEPITLIRETGRYAGAFDGPPTFPADAPARRIDYVFAPAAWPHVGTRVLPGEASDHRAVAATFRLPE